MEVIAQESVKIPCSVVVSGLTETESDEEVSTFLQKYGSVSRFFRIDDPKSGFHKHMIVEFTHGTAMQELEPMLPLKLSSPSQPEITYEVKPLASVYTQEAQGKATKAYMEQLVEIARLSGKSVEQMLKEELSTLSLPTASSQVCHDSSVEQHPQPDPPVPGAVSSPPVPQLATLPDSSVLKPPVDHPHSQTDVTLSKNLTNPSVPPAPPVLAGGFTQPVIDVNPPSVQRVVVEHVVRNSENLPQSIAPGRLRAFSGRSVRPNNEADYDTWRASVEVLIKDPSVSDLHCAHRILDSLLPPASEMIKHLGPHASPSTYLKLLDSAYGAVEDGDELYARFMNTLQNEGEKPSAFLQRLYTALSTTMRRGGVPSQDFDQQLLKQFCRGCWENALIVDLQLEQRKENPPSFAELLLMLRTEEDKQAAKLSRMKQHFGIAKSACSSGKQRVMSHLQTAHVTPDSVQTTEMERLKKQVADLNAQLSRMASESQGQKPQRKQKTKSLASNAKVEARFEKRNQASKPNPPVKGSTKPRPWYCFQCGEDGHVASVCDNAPNPSLVAAKKKQLREKQAAWEASTDLESESHLN
ncbi:zinc finger CCHC domain-containing protein 12 [Melanotaenia boesemani]|uniref:zinc finger CCHC domain-containing protein 12 n=1 Tax=Melanotaenia boesemani TaxID=1250792 RepID=UPI001C049B2C|nr:zinc finger CCHC domain-containing protein 12 [Melanotaenia boesemani]